MTGEHSGWFLHEITKTRIAIQPETGGGILADEMGMGKTLSVLALAMNTKDEAKTWMQKPDMDVSPENYKTRTPATLVLVPSACEVTMIL